MPLSNYNRRIEQLLQELDILVGHRKRDEALPDVSHTAADDRPRSVVLLADEDNAEPGAMPV
jgi:hypothetical protein